MEYFAQYLTILGLLLFIIITRRSIRKNKTREGNKPEAPEPSGPWPVVGHLHLLQGRSHPARVLGKLADEYGPVYSLRLGSRQVLVVSSWKMIKECFTTNERNFATRPNLAVNQYMLYGNAAFMLTQYGPYWREIRKLVTSELFTSQSLEKIKDIRSSEVRKSMADLYVSLENGDARRVMDINKWFEQITLNTNIRMLVGESCFNEFSFENARKLQETIKKGLYLIGVFVLSDVFPHLEWMDIGGHLKAMKQVNIEFDRVVGKWLDQHVDKIQEHDSNEEADFMDVMLSHLPKDAEMFGHRRETIIKATTMSLVFTGAESISLTMTWVLSLLLNHPNILKEAQKEIDIHVGRERLVEDSDIKNLKYLQAIVKETLRMYPPAPLGGPHEATDDCSIGGYHVHKGTRLIVNVWKLHRDTQVWLNPNEFRPERFLEEHSDLSYLGRNFEFIPFGTGRRMCPAASFAMQSVHSTLARLLQGFVLSTPMGKPVDMTEGLGLAMPKVNPLEVILTPRLPSHLYKAN